MRTLPFIRSAASGRSDRTPERDDIAVLISTRNPAGCKSRKNAKGRSSDSFRFRAFPTSASQWQLIAKPLLLLPEQELTAMGIVADSHCIPFSSVARFPQEGVRDTFACTKIENN